MFIGKFSGPGTTGLQLISMALRAPIAGPVVAQTIVVTAPKREETLQAMPVTMQAFTGEQPERFNIRGSTNSTTVHRYRIA